MMINKVYVQILVAMSDLFPNERPHDYVCLFLLIFLFICLEGLLGSLCFLKQNVKHEMYKIKDCE